MNNSTLSNFGQLSVDVDSTSFYFSNSSPVKIRDGMMRLIRYEENVRNFDLEPGLYQVSAVLEDGHEHKSIVEIKPGQQSSVTIRKPEELIGPDERRKKRQLFKPYYETPNFTQKIESLDDNLDQDTLTDVDVEIFEIKGAQIVRETNMLWILNCPTEINSVAIVKLRIGDNETIISLPTSKKGSGADNYCALRIDSSPSGAIASAWISPERTVANAFQNMLASGQILPAMSMADKAIELLRYKYSDPTGAVLGALILNKFGRLAERKSWVRNLARDFAWIPDGKILFAKLKVNGRTDLDTALRLAIESSKQRILYTESYSILLDMLRRWPSEDDSAIRNEAIADLASHSPFVDWDSICLSYTYS
jgi:hypothetical protein